MKIAFLALVFAVVVLGVAESQQCKNPVILPGLILHTPFEFNEDVDEQGFAVSCCYTPPGELVRAPVKYQASFSAPVEQLCVISYRQLTCPESSYVVVCGNNILEGSVISSTSGLISNLTLTGNGVCADAIPEVLHEVYDAPYCNSPIPVIVDPPTSTDAPTSTNSPPKSESPSASPSFPEIPVRSQTRDTQLYECMERSHAADKDFTSVIVFGTAAGTICLILLVLSATKRWSQWGAFIAIIPFLFAVVDIVVDILFCISLWEVKASYSTCLQAYEDAGGSGDLVRESDDAEFLDLYSDEFRKLEALCIASVVFVVLPVLVNFIVVNVWSYSMAQQNPAFARWTAENEHRFILLRMLSLLSLDVFNVLNPGVQYPNRATGAVEGAGSVPATARESVMVNLESSTPEPTVSSKSIADATKEIGIQVPLDEVQIQQVKLIAVSNTVFEDIPQIAIVVISQQLVSEVAWSTAGIVSLVLGAMSILYTVLMRIGHLQLYHSLTKETSTRLVDVPMAKEVTEETLSGERSTHVRQSPESVDVVDSEESSRPKPGGDDEHGQTGGGLHQVDVV